MVKAYEGNESFIFISYAHRDVAVVMPVVDALQSRGFHVWYDGGIEAGSEWPEYIASHLKRSACVLTFISASFVASKNCRRELIYAQDLDKPLLNIYIDEVELSEGMKMQLGLNQALWKKNYPDFESFVTAVCEARILQECRLADNKGTAVPTKPYTASSDGDSPKQMPQTPPGGYGAGPGAYPNRGAAPTGGFPNGYRQAGGPPNGYRPNNGYPNGTQPNGYRPNQGYQAGARPNGWTASPNGTAVPTKAPGAEKIRKPKRKGLSIFLCLIFGLFGLHKFYEGKILFGVLYLLIFAGDGSVGIKLLLVLAWAIDFILLLLKPKYYLPKKGWWRY